MQNAENLSIARGPTSVIKEPTVLWPDQRIGFVKARKGKRSVSSVCLDLMLSYSIKVVVKPNPAVYTIPKSISLIVEDTSEHIVRFLNSMVPLPMMPTYACRSSPSLGKIEPTLGMST